MTLTQLPPFPEPGSWLKIFATTVCLLFCFCLWRAFYNVYLHPLSKYPGPKLFAASSLFRTYYTINGTRVFKTSKQHIQYGPVVRVAPNELSYVKEEAWKDIYSIGSRKGEAQLIKYVLRVSNEKSGIFTNPADATHNRIRKTVSPGFSEKAIRDREPILQQYVGLLIEKLRDRAIRDPVDILAWYECTTVDMIGEMLFSEPFDCLKTSKVHPITYNAFKLLKLVPVILALNDYGIKDMIDKVLGKRIPPAIQYHNSVNADKIERRLARGEITEMPDLISYMPSLAGLERQCLTRDLLLGGADTVATALSAITYLLTKHRAELEAVTDEIRSAFQTEEEITLNRIGTLKYFAAVISESLRLFPAGPETIKRITGPSGNVIAGQFVPPNTQVSIAHWAAYHQPYNFRFPEDFIPERWLGGVAYRNDKRGVFQPFAVGPRNCVGQNLANAEMRLILARVLWNFDIELCPESIGWMNVKAYCLVWDKRPLMVHLRAVTRNQII